MFVELKKLLSLFFILMFALFQFATPALASTSSVDIGNGHASVVAYASNDDSTQRPNDFFNNCFSGQPTTGRDEVACNITKDVVTDVAIAGIIVGGCVVADTLAAKVFPPAEALRPLCNYLVGGGAGRQVANSLAN